MIDTTRADGFRPELLPFAPSFDVNDWYWLAEDGRIFSSARQSLVSKDDKQYLEFRQRHRPTTWPRDRENQQTDAVLQIVLAARGGDLFASLDRYAANRRWEIENGGIKTSVGVPLRTDDRSKTMIIGSAFKAQLEPEFTTIWIGSDGGSYPLTNDQIKQLAIDLQTHIDRVFAAFNEVVEKINKKEITTHEAVNDFFRNAMKD